MEVNQQDDKGSRVYVHECRTEDGRRYLQCVVYASLYSHNTTDRPHALNFADLTVFAVLVFLASVVKRVPIVIGQIFWFAKLTGKHVLSAHDFQTMGLVDSAF